MVVALEPLEALRTLEPYGNPDVLVIANTRPVHPIGVICGDQDYPSIEQVDSWLTEFSGRHWLLPATDEAVKMGVPILANIIIIGALAGTKVLPIDRDRFSEVVAGMMPQPKANMNLEAFDLGSHMVN